MKCFLLSGLFLVFWQINLLAQPPSNDDCANAFDLGVIEADAGWYCNETGFNTLADTIDLNDIADVLPSISNDRYTLLRATRENFNNNFASCPFDREETIWFKFQTGSDVEFVTIYAGILSATSGRALGTPAITFLYNENYDCSGNISITCNSDLDDENPLDGVVAYEDFQGDNPTAALKPNTTYYFMVSNAELGAVGRSVDICIEAFTVSLNNKCVLRQTVEPIATSLGSPLDGPYKPGETVEFEYHLKNYRIDPLGKGNNCQYLQGIMPMFGNAWNPQTLTPIKDPDQRFSPTSWIWLKQNSIVYTLDLAENPIINKYFDDGILKLCHENIGCPFDAIPLLGNDIDSLPAAWWARLPNQDTNDPENPNETFGDGPFGSTPDYPQSCPSILDGPYRVGEWTSRFSLQLKCELDQQCQSDFNVQVFTFGDGETGNFQNPGCELDEPALFQPQSECYQLDIMLNDTKICIGSNLGINIIRSHPSEEISISLDDLNGSIETFSNEQDFEDFLSSTNNPAPEYEISVSYASFGCSPVFKRFEVLPPINAEIVPAGALCIGQTVEFELDRVYTNYLWDDMTSGPSITRTLTDQTEIYVVTVTDNNGCEDVASITFTPETPIPVEITNQNPSVCNGQSLTLSASNGFDSYLWLDDNGATLPGGQNQDLVINGPGNYTVRGTDINGCFSERTISVDQGNLTAPIILGASQICNGTVSNILSTDSTYDSYEWVTPNGTESTPTVNATVPGIYTLNVENDGCFGTAIPFMVRTIVPTQPDIIPSLPGLCDGESVSFSVNGGQIQSYLWSTGSTDPTVSLVLDGTQDISVVVTDSNNCTAQAFFEASSTNMNPSVFINGGGALPCGETSAILEADVTSNVSFEWRDSGGFPVNAQGERAIVNVPDIYTVIVTDANGCTAEESVQVDFRTEPVIVGLADDEVCEGQTTSIGVVNDPDMTYSWSGDATGSTSTIDVGPGTYTLALTNDQGCTSSQTITVNLNPLPDPRLESSGDLCELNEVRLSVVNGSFESFEWSTGDQGTASDLLVQLPASTVTYMVTVTDENGCTNTAELEINPDQVDLISVDGDRVVCDNKPTVLSVNPDPSFDKYQWFDPDGNEIGTSQSINITDGGTYTVVVTNDMDCFNDPPKEITIVDNSVGPIGIDPIIEVCDEAITARVDAPTGLTYSWGFPDGNTSTNNFIDAEPGSYNLTVTNLAQCTAETSFEIIYFTESIPEIEGPDEFCLTENVSIALTVTADDVQAVLWGNGETTPSINVDLGAFYSVTVTDSNGCRASVEKQVTANALPDVQSLFSFDGTFCDGSSGTLEFLGSETAYSIDLGNDGTIDRTENNPFTQTLVTDQEIRVIVENAAGCSDFMVLNPTVYPLPELNTIPDSQQSFCSDGGSTTLDAGTGMVEYVWFRDQSLLPATNTSTILVDQEGTYTVAVTDINGCQNSKSVVVVELDMLLPNVIGNDICDNELVVLEAGIGFSTYQWLDANGNLIGDQRTIEVSEAGDYRVNVTDASNCMGQGQITINAFSTPVLMELQNVEICNDPNNTQGLSSILNIDQQVTNVSGLWRDIDGLGIDLNSNASALSFDGIQEGMYRLEFNTNSAIAPCIDIRDTLVVFVSDCSCPSIALSGPMDFCNESSSENFNLNSLLATTESGEWTQTSGPENRLLGNEISIANGLPGSYEFTYTVDNSVANCAVSNSLVVNIFESLTAPTLSDVFVCNDPGNSRGLDFELDLATQVLGFSGDWIDVDGLGLDLDNNLNQVDFTNVPVGEYELRFLTNSAQAPCVNVESSLMVEVSDCLCPSISFLPTTPLCNALGSGDVNLDDYLDTTESGAWAQISGPENRLTDKIFSSEEAMPGIYEFSFTINANVVGCTRENTIQFEVQTAPFAGTPTNTSNLICLGESNIYNLFELIDGEDTGGEWVEVSTNESTANAFDATSASFNVTGQLPNTYGFMYVVDANACAADSEVITIEVQQLPSVQIEDPEIISCGLSEVILDGSRSTAANDLIFVWTDENNNVVSNEMSFTTDVAGVYQLQVMDILTGCSSFESKEVIADVSIPSFTLEKLDPSCNDDANGFIMFQNLEGGSGTYEFSIDGGLTYSGDAEYFDLAPNEYLVRVRDDRGCVTVPEIVRLSNPARLIVDAGEDIATIKGFDINLSFDSNIPNDEIADVAWKTLANDSLICGGVICQSTNLVAENGVVTYCVEVTSVSGCIATDCIDVLGETVVSIYIPNVIKPTVEVPSNKFFYVSGTEDILGIREMKIFDRWGTLVFTKENFPANQPTEGWDGRNTGQGSRTGPRDFEEGVYIYYILVDYLGVPDPILRKGTVTLVK